MASEYDESEFVDRDLMDAQRGVAPSRATANRPPSYEELTEQVTSTQGQLSELRQKQETLERQRTMLEESRRRQAEFYTGREEVQRYLTRGLGLLEEAEFDARKQAEQMRGTVEKLREAMDKVEAINEEGWTNEDLNIELTRALTIIENARMEWNTAKQKWDILSDNSLEIEAKPADGKPFRPLTEPQTFVQLCRVGFALTWPVLAGSVLVSILLLMIWMKG